MPSLYIVIFIALGGALGSVSRYLLGTWTQSLSQSIDFPYGTLTVNLTGCFMIGFLSQLAEPQIKAGLVTIAKAQIKFYRFESK